MSAKEIQIKLQELGNIDKAKKHQIFFKTGPGEYGEGDVFVGVTVPELRKLAKEYKTITLKEVKHLLRSPIHEERLLSLFLLIHRYSKGDEPDKKRIYELYLKNTKFINNWDLVDSSAGHIVGAFLSDKSKKPLYDLVKSDNLWERRISIISTFYFIKRNQFSDTLKISKILLSDKEDLIHKAVGWMLREVGKRDISVEEIFLKKHYKNMPRTMLRYAIEKFPESKRQRYLKGKI
ncbi:MAG: DNA alkylation repair protein [Deltaproteobacteria bacterium]|nr:DNA alkylation repair protein [Deltaproteobacteria bacterium]MBW2563713.1 DNA alkylation repair protein [Deltaproteobacteria bacterium]